MGLPNQKGNILQIEHLFSKSLVWSKCNFTLWVLGNLELEYFFRYSNKLS